MMRESAKQKTGDERISSANSFWIPHTLPQSCRHVLRAIAAIPQNAVCHNAVREDVVDGSKGMVEFED